MNGLESLEEQENRGRNELLDNDVLMTIVEVSPRITLKKFVATLDAGMQKKSRQQQTENCTSYDTNSTPYFLHLTLTGYYQCFQIVEKLLKYARHFS